LIACSNGAAAAIVSRMGGTTRACQPDRLSTKTSGLAAAFIAGFIAAEAQ